jgi:hypothetical protein
VSHEEITTVLDRLVDTFDEESGDWAAILERAADRGATVPTRKRRRLLVLAAPAAIGIAAVALWVAAPWRGGPSIVERAAAAIAGPTSEQILHEAISVHVTPTPPPPAIRRAAHGHYPTIWVAHVQIWLNGAASHRFRVTMTAQGRDATGKSLHQPSSEIGGTLGSVEGLGYDASAGVLDPVPFQNPVRQAALDPVAFIRNALTAKHAHVEGRTTLHGREAIRIRVTATPYGHVETVAIYYVDAQTYRPIRIVIDQRRPLAGAPQPAMPATSLTLTQFATLPPTTGRYVFDFGRYEHLTPAAGNRKLSDIRAAHPGVKIS